MMEAKVVLIEAVNFPMEFQDTSENLQQCQGIWQALRSEIFAPDGLFKNIRQQSLAPARQSWWPVYRWALGWSNPWYRMEIESSSKSIPDLYPNSSTVQVTGVDIFQFSRF